MADLSAYLISGDEFHDWNLTSISVGKGGGELLLNNDEGGAAKIEFHGVKYFLVNDFLEGNIIGSITRHVITEESVDLVMRCFLNEGSEYFNEKSVGDIVKSGSLIGKFYIAVHPVYGAAVHVIAERFTDCKCF